MRQRFMSPVLCMTVRMFKPNYTAFSDKTGAATLIFNDKLDKMFPDRKKRTERKQAALQIVTYCTVRNPIYGADERGL